MQLEIKGLQTSNIQNTIVSIPLWENILLCNGWCLSSVSVCFVYIHI